MSYAKNPKPSHGTVGGPRTDDSREATTELDAAAGKRGTATEFDPVRKGGSATLRVGAVARAESSGAVEGEVIDGRYELVERIDGNRGAFGEVWEAHDGEFDRRVALKILKAKMCRPEVLDRFQLEKQVIARMEHPNIARVFDGGALRDGRPFLSMELLREARTLTAYCDEERLSVEARLRVFMQICRAVHHAHERFVLHRDLKPSNILVVTEDGVPVPKVIDFGIAKVLAEGDFTADGAQTIEGSIKGTPRYMSPEQTRTRDVEMTARSDIYTLGVILYELLAGDTPLPHEKTRSSDAIDLFARIREEEPRSLRLAAVAKAAELAAARRVAAMRLLRLLRGDLEVIARRALEKEPARRYDSAADLAADVQRYLDDEPILAQPPSAWYRLKKFTRRHRAGVTAATVVLVALVATAAISTQSYFAVRTAFGRESAARQVAEERKTEALREKQRAVEARAVAEKKEAEALVSRNAALVARGQAEDLINYMLFNLREQLEPLGRSRLLDGVSLKAEEYFEKQPVETDDETLERNRAVMHYNRGRLLLAQGDVTGAVSAFRQARQAMDARLGKKDEPPRRLDAATAAHGLGLALRASGAGEEARPLFEQGLEFLRGRSATRDGEAVRVLAANLEQLGELEDRAGRPEEALKFFREQEDRLRELSQTAPTDRRVAVALAIAGEKVGGALDRLGRPEQALPKYEEEVRLLRTQAAESFDDLMLRRSLSVALEKQGNALLALKRPEEARSLFEARLRESELLSRVDPRNRDFQRDLAVAHQGLAAALAALGRRGEALAEAREDLRLAEALAAKYPDDPVLQRDLAGSHYAFGLLGLRGAPPRTAEIDEAKQHLAKSRGLLQALVANGKIDVLGQRLLGALEAAFADLEKVARPAARAER
jgi:serine/threonine protein kinase